VSGKVKYVHLGSAHTKSVMSFNQKLMLEVKHFSILDN